LPYDPRVPLVRTFIRVVDEGPHTDKLLDDLEARLAGRASVGRREPPEAIVVIFFDDPPMDEQHAAVVAELDAIDESAGRQAGEWRSHLAIER
jgi:hypothetical protein